MSVAIVSILNLPKIYAPLYIVTTECSCYILGSFVYSEVLDVIVNNNDINNNNCNNNNCSNRPKNGTGLTSHETMG